MTDEEADWASETDAPLSLLLTSLLISLFTRLYGYDYEFDGLLAELKRRINSGGAGADRELVAVMRDLHGAVSSLKDFTVEVVELLQEPDWDARVRAIAAENGGLCAITFYTLEESSDLELFAYRKDRRAAIHDRTMWLMIKGIETKQLPPRCVVCYEGTAEARWPKRIMVLEGHGEHPEFTVAGRICEHCVSKHRSEAALRNAVVNAFRERLEVHLRVLQSAQVLPGRVH